MEIKGNIGEVVYIKASIRTVKITEEGVKYNVLVPGLGYADLEEENIVFQEEVKEEPKEEPEKEPEPKRFIHAQWLREEIKKSGFSQKEYCDRLNDWLQKKHKKGKYEDIKSYYSSDLSNYMNGKVYISEYKIKVIKDYAKEMEKAVAEIPEKPLKVETPEYKKATVESTMAKLRKMRGGI